MTRAFDWKFLLNAFDPLRVEVGGHVCVVTSKYEALLQVKDSLASVMDFLCQNRLLTFTYLPGDYVPTVLYVYSPRTWSLLL